MITPYLIIDNDLCTSIESAALRGVDVRIIVPHIPDKKIVFEMTKSFYHRNLKRDIDETLAKSQEVTHDMLKTGLIMRFIRSVVRIFAPML